MSDRTSVYINGQWTAPAGNGRIAVENPATESTFAFVPEGTAADVDRAVAAARDAFPAWSQTSPAYRRDVLQALADGMATRTQEFAETITAEMGAPAGIAAAIQAPLPQTIVRSYVDILENFEWSYEVGNTLVAREAAGVVGAITPWNYPLHQIICKLGPALAAGCTFVLKPSELTPLSAYLLFDVLHELGLPPGVVNLVPGYGSEVGAALAGHPGLDVVSFTGSVASGAKVAAAAAPNITRVTLELGGKSANVILDDADLKLAVKIGIAKAFLNCGQTCTAWTRMLVPSHMYEEALQFAAGFAESYIMGDPTLTTTKLGPLASKAQRDKVRGLIDAAVSEGARVVTGGSAAPDDLPVGYYVRPTVLADVRPDSTIAQTEVFGPVLAVMSYDGDDEAVAIANDSDYGLHGGVWSADIDRAMSVARRMRTGSVDINGAAYNPIAPLGGYKKSGYGRELGAAGMDEYLSLKSIGRP